MVIGVSLGWSLAYASAVEERRSEIGPTAADTISAATATEPVPRPVPGEHGIVLRTIPTVSKPISVGGTTLVPYIGAGFGGGYATEIDRSLNTPQSASPGSLNAGQKNLLGQQLVPNEVQLGIRFPF